VNNLPPVLDSDIASKNPMLAKAIAASQILDIFMRDKSLAVAEEKDGSDRLVEAAASSGIDFDTTFDMLDSHQLGYLDISELAELFASLGTYDVTPHMIKQLLEGGKQPGVLTKEEFKIIMSQSSAKVAHH
jgi:hypothetical protein